MFSVLLLEDVVTDAELVLRTLKRSGMNFTPTIAQNREDFTNAVKTLTFDVILADNSLPQFSAAEALEIYNQLQLVTPFILVTGSISEEYAVEIMKLGACDYVLKDRLQRLPNAITGAIHKRSLETERKKYLDEVIANEALLKEAERLAQVGSWETDLVSFVQRWSDEQYHILGYQPGEIEASISNFLRRVHPDDVTYVKTTLDAAFIHVDRQKYDCRIITRDGIVKQVHGEMAVKRNENGKALRINGFIRDVSETKRAEEKEKKMTSDLVQRNKDLEQFAYIVSHNLRAPVANIVGVTNILLIEPLNEQEKAEFMDGLSSSVRKLDEVIIDLNYILQVKNTVNEHKDIVDFLQVVNDIKASIGHILQDDSIKIICDFEEVPRMSTLKSYIHSIFYNLISNSIKFRYPNRPSSIEIKSRKNKDKIEITFKDNGIGIDLQKKSNYVFGLYKRFHPDHAEGKGMGLFMVKTQVEALGGRINVQSKVNEGTEFKIEFDGENALDFL